MALQPRSGPVQANRPGSNSQTIRTPPPPQKTVVSSNQAPPSPTPNHEESENDIESDLYEGLVEALEEAQNQRSNTEVQCKYEELLREGCQTIKSRLSVLLTEPSQLYFLIQWWVLQKRLQVLL